MTEKTFIHPLCIAAMENFIERFDIWNAQYGEGRQPKKRKEKSRTSLEYVTFTTFFEFKEVLGEAWETFSALAQRKKYVRFLLFQYRAQLDWYQFIEENIQQNGFGFYRTNLFILTNEIRRCVADFLAERKALKKSLDEGNN